jgi:plastocyanin
MAADPACQAKHDGPVYSEVLVLGDGNTMGNIWIHVKSGLPEKDWGVPSKPAVMDQNGCQYMPHVIGVMQGQDLVFLNQDNLLHNVHGQPAANREFNLGMPPTRAVAEAPKLTTPEPMFPIKCDVHPWMQSYAAVVADPYFEVTETDGQYSLDRLPAGTYEIEAWHERLGTQTQTVTVGDGETVSADFVFTRPSA